MNRADRDARAWQPGDAHTPRRFGAAGLAALLFLGLASVSQGAEIEHPVTAGREAFESGRFPWYDAQQDARKADQAGAAAPERKPIELPKWTTTAAWVLVAVVLVALVVILFLVFRDSSGLRPRPAAGGEEVLDAQRVEALPFLAERPRGDLLALARRHYFEGNYSEAIIYLFSYELVALDKLALVRLVRGKTNRQYLRELARPNRCASRSNRR